MFGRGNVFMRVRVCPRVWCMCACVCVYTHACKYEKFAHANMNNGCSQVSEVSWDTGVSPGDDEVTVRSVLKSSLFVTKELI